MYVAKHLGFPHCVKSLAQAGELFRGKEEFLVRYYDPNHNHSNEFLLVRNDLSEDEYPFQALGQTLSLADNSSSPPTNQVIRQVAGPIINLGFTTSQSMRARDPASGCAKPVLKAGSAQQPFTSCFVAASNLFRGTNLKWLGGKPISVSRERLGKFAKSIHSDNLFEGATHVGRSECEQHSDIHNPSKEDPMKSFVVCISGSNTSSIFYQRKSICGYEAAVFKTSKYVDWLVKGYAAFREEQRHFSPKSIPTGVGFVSKTPNLDPKSHHSLFLATILTLVIRFKLSLAELVALFMVVSRTPNRAEPFVKAVIWDLRKGSQGQGKGFKFGYGLLKKSKEFEPTNTCSPRWQSNHQRIHVGTYESFREHGKQVFWAIVQVWNKSDTATSKPPLSTINATYSEVDKSFQKAFGPGTGPLTSRHLIQMMSAFGLLPPWLKDHASFDKAGRVYGHLKEEFGFGVSDGDARKALLTGMHALKGRFPCFVATTAMTENVNCKVYQCRSGSKNCARETHFVGAPVIYCDPNGCLWLKVREEMDPLRIGVSVISTWHAQHRVLSMMEIAQSLQLDIQVPNLAYELEANVKYGFENWW